MGLAGLADRAEVCPPPLFPSAILNAKVPAMLDLDDNGLRTALMARAAEGQDALDRMGALDDDAAAPFISLADETRRAGRPDIAVRLLESLTARMANSQETGPRLALAYRDVQDLAAADTILTRLVGTQHADQTLLFVHAQTRYERGLPAAALFERALAIAPDHLDILRNYALALASEAQAEESVRRLSGALSVRPEWVDGHSALAMIRWASGQTKAFTDSIRSACTARPRDWALWSTWFGLRVQARDWRGAEEVLDAAEKALGQTAPITACRFVLATESGDYTHAELLFQSTHTVQGETLNLARVRHLLRTGRIEHAHNVAIAQLQGPGAGAFWPYASLIWRLLSDPRAEWLDRTQCLVRAFDNAIPAEDMAELSGALRRLHANGTQYLEQSIRDGTQTDRSILLRAEPIFERIRRSWMATLRCYIDDLPARERLHPLLGRDRTELQIAGSWSVRLSPGGHNVPHTHPMGWISSVLYVEIPEGPDAAGAPEGSLVFGVPPDDLGLTLGPVGMLAPKPGQIVAFPSTTWHSTVPVRESERMVIALDLKPPRY